MPLPIEIITHRVPGIFGYGVELRRMGDLDWQWQHWDGSGLTLLDSGRLAWHLSAVEALQALTARVLQGEEMPRHGPQIDPPATPARPLIYQRGGAKL
jgi:hypothetical protein